MKIELIAGFLLLTGGLWALSIAFIIANNLLLNSDARSLWANIIEMNLLPQITISAVLILLGGVLVDN